MLIKYKIIKVAPEERTILVRFYSDHATSTEEAMAIRNPDTGAIIRNPDGTIESCRTDYNITMWQVPALSGQALADMIAGHAPRQWFDLIAQEVDSVGYAAMGAAVGQEMSIPTPVPEIPLTEAEVLAMIAAANPAPSE